MTALLEQLAQQTLQGALGQYRLERYLGGGQTAAVYAARVVDGSVAARIGQAVALKLMLPNLDSTTQRRFLEEADTLLQLDHLLGQVDETVYAPALAGAQLVPKVLDQGQRPFPFIAMTLAQGQPLDELLRHGWQNLSEHEVLTLSYQLLTVFVALHEGLQRSYLDFQPRNVFWDAASRSLTLVDWNLLSRSEEAAVQRDLLTLARLFHRLVVGSEASDVTPAALARPARWRALSLAMRALILDLLAPGSTVRTTARAIRARLAEPLQLWSQSGDQLLIQATEVAARMDALATDSEKYQQLRRLQLLVDLAERRSFSSYWAVAVHSLQAKLQEDADRLSWLNRGRAFLQAADDATAESLFGDAVEQAETDALQLVAWRWLTVTHAARSDIEGYRVVAEPLTTLLTDAAVFEQWAANPWTAGVAALEELAWPGAAPIQAEWQAYATFQRLASVDAIALQQEPASTIRALLHAGEEAVVKLDQLPGKRAGSSYAASAWSWIGDGDEQTGRQAVAMWLDALRRRSEQLNAFSAHLAADPPPAQAAELVRTYAGDAFLVSVLLARCQDWLADAAHDAGVTALLAAVLDSAQREELVRQARQIEAQLRRLHEVTFWLETLSRAMLEVAALEAAPAQSEDLEPTLAVAAALPPVEHAATPPTETNEDAADVGWQPDALRLLLLFATAQVDRIHRDLADFSGLKARLAPHFAALAEASIVKGQNGESIESLLQHVAPEALAQRAERWARARRDQELEKKIVELTARQKKLAQEADELEERHKQREKELEDDYNYHKQELNREFAERKERLEAKRLEQERQQQVDKERHDRLTQGRQKEIDVLYSRSQQLLQGIQALKDEQKKREAQLRELERQNKNLSEDYQNIRLKLDQEHRTFNRITDQARPATVPPHPVISLEGFRSDGVLWLGVQIVKAANLRDNTSRAERFAELANKNNRDAQSAWRLSEDRLARSYIKQGLNALFELAWRSQAQAEIEDFVTIHFADAPWLATRVREQSEDLKRYITQSLNKVETKFRNPSQ